MASDGAPPSKDRGGGDGRDGRNSVEFLDSASGSSMLTNNIATFGNTLSPNLSSTRFRSDGSSIFATPPNSNSNPTPLDSPELPEKVRHYTSEFCAEFKRLMDSFGDKVVENLTPMTIEVLEQLQEVITANQRAVDEIDMLREDKQQLITQYEREKQSRRQSEQRLMSLEDETAVVESESQKKIDELESVVRVLELRAKNEADHAVRLEERESDIKKDYQKLHDKYTELWRTHADNIERTKMLLGPSAEELLVKAKAGTIKEARIMLLECAKENVMLSESSSLIAAPSTPRQFSTQSSVNTPVSGGDADRGGAHRSPNPAMHAPQQVSGQIVEELTFDEEIASRSMEFDAENERKFGEETGDSGTLEVSESYDGEEHAMESTSSLRHEIEEGLLLPSLGNAMSREIDNLIAENKELLDMKNALNVVKNDLLTRVEELGGEVTMRDDELSSVKAARDKYKQRLQESEEKFRAMRDGYEQKLQEYYKKEEEVSNAEQKRFTRAEMHKLIQERNRYKEQLMELQDQIRWRERSDATTVVNNPPVPRRGGILSYFISLLPSRGGGGGMPTSQSSMTLSSSSAAAGPLGGVSLNNSAVPNRRLSAATLPANNTSSSSPTKSAVSRARGSDLTLGSSKTLGDSPTPAGGNSVHPFADGRVEAFGWSVPQSHVTTTTAPIINSRKTKSAGGGDAAYKSAIENANSTSQASSAAAVLNRNIPVPVHCRPIEHCDSGMKAFETSTRALDTTSPQQQQQLSSYVWLCSSTHSMSQVSIIDADRPDHVLASFSMHGTQLLCCASVSGVQPTHYPTRAQMNFLANAKTRTIQRPNITSKLAPAGSNDTSPAVSRNTKAVGPSDAAPAPSRRDLAAPLGSITFVRCSTGNEPPAAPPTTTAPPPVVEPGTPTPSTTTFNITQVDANYVNSSKLIQSFEPTVWLGGQNGVIYIHSAVNNNRNTSSTAGNALSERLFRIQLQDSIVAMVHCRGRVFVACADGQVAVFHRYSREAVGVSPALEHVKEMQSTAGGDEAKSLSDLEGFWDIGSYHLIDIGKPQHSVRCMCVVADDTVWACYRNKVHVLDPITLRVRATFDAHPREESSVRNLAWCDDGVWLSIRLDSTLRLFHAFTYEHLQDVDVEPFVGCMLRANRTLGFTLIRITALLVACRQLWIGTSNGVIVSVPLSNDNETASSAKRRLLRQPPQSPKTTTLAGDADNTTTKAAAALTGDNEADVYAGKLRSASTTTSSLPFCAIADARISCLGHKDVVKFFVAVPAGTLTTAEKSAADSNSNNNKAKANKLPGEEGKASSTVLIMSGGEGCVDFRHPDNDDSSGKEKLLAVDVETASVDKSTATTPASGDENVSAIELSTASSSSNKTDDIVNVLSSSTQNSRTASGGDMSHLLMWSLANV